MAHLTDDQDEDDLDPLPVRIAADRRCLACNSTFRSRSAANRICGKCRRLEAWTAGISECVVTSGEYHF
jgi:hypothetical protein